MLLGIFVMLRVSDVLCFQATYDAVHPSPAMRGMTMIAAVWTTIFLTAVWLQKRWARYLLAISVGAVVAFDVLAIFSRSFDQLGAITGPTVAYTIQCAVYLGALSILARSEDIRRLVERSRLPVTVSGLV